LDVNRGKISHKAYCGKLEFVALLHGLHHRWDLRMQFLLVYDRWIMTQGVKSDSIVHMLKRRGQFTLRIYDILSLQQVNHANQD